MNGWQLIEIAPKDGTEILSFGPDPRQTMAVIAWSTRDKEWFLCDGHERPDWIGVTHWMPLPPPPLSGLPPVDERLHSPSLIGPLQKRAMEID